MVLKLFWIINPKHTYYIFKPKFTILKTKELIVRVHFSED